MTERLHFDFSLSCIGEGNGSHSSVLVWRIPGTWEPGGLPSMGSQSQTQLKRLSSSSSEGKGPGQPLKPFRLEHTGWVREKGNNCQGSVRWEDQSPLETTGLPA